MLDPHVPIRVVDVRYAIVRGVHASPLASAMALDGLMATSHEVTDVAVAVETERVECIVPRTSDISEWMPTELPDLLGGVNPTAPSES